MNLNNGKDPCQYMEALLNRAAEERSVGFWLWFTLRHVAGCPGCKNYFEDLKKTRAMLKAARAAEDNQDAISRLSAKLKGISAN